VPHVIAECNGNASPRLRLVDAGRGPPRVEARASAGRTRCRARTPTVPKLHAPAPRASRAPRSGNARGATQAPAVRVGRSTIMAA
jgi:hypothetical protein